MEINAIAILGPQVTDNVVVHGYVTNTNIRLLVIITLPEHMLRGSDVQRVLRQIHVAYVSVVCNPFFNFKRIDGHVAEPGLIDKELSESVKFSILLSKIRDNALIKPRVDSFPPQAV
ncbi:hypothetical protein H4219_004031 [Mycoemilia scoparia]|uniref:Uncharacterized protein n=1 Tax=Mycoemilia scoparia TaxID=417184 RepID=A0A9W8DNF6_9FUNG|nr:hypothetical protein H4219_004031 [Mycoemilia scoparia]